MSDTAPALDAADGVLPAPAPSVTANVDAALGRWRVETDRRRDVWASKHAVFLEEQRRRRDRLKLFAGTAGLAFAATLAVSALAWSQWSEAVVFASAPAAVAPAAPGTIDQGEMIAPVRRVTEPSSAVGVQGPVVSWQNAGTLWIQVDLTAPGGSVRWLDASGAEVLERNACDTALVGGRHRCFVGRTPWRIDQAIEAGAAPGTWTAQACNGGACSTVAHYTVGR